MSNVNENDKNSNSSILNIFLWILLLCFLFIPGYFFYISFIEDTTITSDDTEDTTADHSSDISEDTSTPAEEDTENIYNENPVEGENFFEKFPIVNDQQSYIAVPMRVDTENPPAIVIYNHGDYEVISDSIPTDFMEKLRAYSVEFTSNNYIFAASAIHDNENTNGNSAADIKLLIEWIQGNYTASTDIYLIGFSRGGYTTTNYILEYPESIKGVALLAPATYYTEWNQARVDIIMDIPMQIWHGTDDVNIAIIHSENFIDRLAEYGKSVDIIEKEDKAHFDIDNEYINEILEFFESSIQ